MGEDAMERERRHPVRVRDAATTENMRNRLAEIKAIEMWAQQKTNPDRSEAPWLTPKGLALLQGVPEILGPKEYVPPNKRR